jgi:hypothetical protein
MSDATLDAALDEINRLRAAINVHRDWTCDHTGLMTAADIDLWRAIKEDAS